jgi:DNA polymerase-3 subunit gamma/tau
LLNHFRNLLLYQLSQGDLSLLEVSEAEEGVLRQQSAQAAADGLTRIMDLLSEYEGRLRDAASKRILVEVALLKAVQVKNAVSIDTVLHKLQQLRSANPAPTPAPAAQAALSGSPAPAAVEPAPAPRPNPPPAAPISPAKPSNLSQAGAEAIDLGGLWNRIVEDVGRASAFARTYLMQAHPVSFVRNILTIGVDPQFADQLTLVDNPKNRTLVQTKLQELGYAGAQVKFVQAEAPAGWVRTAPAPAEAVRSEPASVAPEPSPAVEKRPASAPAQKPAAAGKDDFKNDPLIKQALDIFKGQIVEVRA